MSREVYPFRSVNYFEKILTQKARSAKMLGWCLAIVRRRGYVFGKPGCPPEDKLARQREIYEAVAPLILEVGPRRLSMLEAARGAHERGRALPLLSD